MNHSVIHSIRLKLTMYAFLSIAITIAIQVILIMTTTGVRIIRYELRHASSAAYSNATDMWNDTFGDLIISNNDDEISLENAPKDSVAVDSHNNVSSVTEALDQTTTAEKVQYFFRVPPEVLIAGNPILSIIYYLVTTVLIFMITYVCLSHDMVVYFREINKVILNVANGNLDDAVRVRGNDELAELAMSVNRMREVLRENERQEREAEAIKDELITSVAHDLRTPLTSVIGYLELLKMDSISEDDKKKYLDITSDKARRLQSMIVDLFDYTRYDNNKMSIKMNRIDLNQFMIQMEEEFYPQMQEEKLTCVTDFPSGSIPIMADGDLLARAISNIISNAIRYGRDGKMIKLSLRKTEDQNHAVVSVVNYGQTIKEEDLNRIFDKFYRTEESRNTETGGTGLGLAIAKNIVKMHGGDITVTSGVNGTDFRLYFPMAK